MTPRPELALEALPFFRGCTPDEFERARAVLYRKALPLGYTLVSEAQVGETVYFLLSGSAKVVIESATGPTVMGVRGAGEIVGEMSVLDGMSRSATVITNEESVVLWASRHDFWNTLWKLEPVPYNVANLLAQRLRVLTTQTQALASLDVQGRLARQLLVMAYEYGVDVVLPDKRAGRELPFALLQGELASMIGSTREGISRLLSVWKQNGWVATDGGRLVVLESEPLSLFYLKRSPASSVS